MLTINQYLLTKVAEEAAEVAQMAMKCSQFGLNEIFKAETLSNNAERLINEVLDMLTSLQLLEQRGALKLPTQEKVAAYSKLKAVKIETYLRYSQQIGQTEQGELYDVTRTDPDAAGNAGEAPRRPEREGGGAGHDAASSSGQLLHTGKPGTGGE